MARIISIANAKGGVGKTTTAVSLSAYLAARGKYVLLVDLDPQANATAGIGIAVKEDEPHIYHAVIDDLHPAGLIRKTALFGYDIIPAHQALAGANVELVSVPQREFRLRKTLNRIRTDYDYILIDCPPTLGLLTINGLVAAEEILIPVQSEFFALEGLSQLFQTINMVREHLNPELNIMGVLVTMYDKRNRLSRDVLGEVQRGFPGYVFQTVIPRSIRLAEAPSFGKSILQFDSSSRGGKAYKKLAQEIIELLEEKKY